MWVCSDINILFVHASLHTHVHAHIRSATYFPSQRFCDVLQRYFLPTVLISQLRRGDNSVYLAQNTLVNEQDFYWIKHLLKVPDAHSAELNVSLGSKRRISTEILKWFHGLQDMGTAASALSCSLKGVINVAMNVKYLKTLEILF